MSYFIGTRMHSNIFALSSGIKTLAISYEPKTEGIMKDLGLSEYVIKIENVNSRILNEKFNKLISDDNYQKKLNESLILLNKTFVDFERFL